jgi:hypothetical protein
MVCNSLTVTQIIKKFPAFYGSAGSFPCSQEPAFKILTVLNQCRDMKRQTHKKAIYIYLLTG